MKKRPGKFILNLNPTCLRNGVYCDVIEWPLLLVLDPEEGLELGERGLVTSARLPVRVLVLFGAILRSMKGAIKMQNLIVQMCFCFTMPNARCFRWIQSIRELVVQQIQLTYSLHGLHQQLSLQ